MRDINKSIQAGYAALQRGDFASARRELRNIRHPKAVHLLGLVEKNAGNADDATKLLTRAASMDPNDPEIANNLALTAQEAGQPGVAEREFRRALALRPDFSKAALGLGGLLNQQERWDDALPVFEQLRSTAPGEPVIKHSLGVALLGLGRAEEAVALFDALLEENHERPEVRFMRGRARLELGKTDAAVDDLEKAFAAMPSRLTFEALASTYWVRGNQAAFDALIRNALRTPELVVAAAEILRQRGTPNEALNALQQSPDQIAGDVESRSVAASAYMDLHQPENAEVEARAGLAIHPKDHAARRSLIVSLLMQGKAGEALPYIEAMRQAEPLGQQWLAYETTALRLLGSDRYESLMDLERLVRPYALPVPEGFSDIESFNLAFLAALDEWHQLKTHPLNQSLRDGSQTPRDLTTIDHPVFRAFYQALDVPIRQYMADVGEAGDHPLTARNTGEYRITGGWSVRLHGGGRHVNHVHPEGWISSSYYVSVPDETKTDAGKAGWIKFGEPPFETLPACSPQKWIRPEAGMLVLFPSYVWHGTQPIHDGSVRVTAPFDAIPAAISD